MTSSPWRMSDRADPALAALADRHYPRQRHGSRKFIAPGHSLALITADKTTGWVSRWPKYAQHAWPGAWENPLFRKEGGGLASEMILHAVAHTRYRWPSVPALGMITFIDPDALPGTNPGYCYLMAGFRRVGWTTERKRLVLQLLPADMPDPEPVPLSQAQLFTMVQPEQVAG